ncbi:MAG: ABC transporter permease, partial [Pelagibacteraceae bacterium]|nr:ABC transporter permease [Pelagibacteraceae bacterium]
MNSSKIINFGRDYAVLILIVLLMIVLSLASDAFLTPRNLLNILNQNAPLAIIACALTLVIIVGGFDLSTGAIFAVASVSSAYIAINFNPYLGLLLAPIIGIALGYLNGIIITTFKVHSFLSTIATSLVFRGLAILITGGFLIPVRMKEFTWLGREKIFEVHVAVYVLIVFAILSTFILTKTTVGRYIFAIGGNEDASILSGIKVNLVKIFA